MTNDALASSFTGCEARLDFVKRSSFPCRPLGAGGQMNQCVIELLEARRFLDAGQLDTKAPQAHTQIHTGTTLAPRDLDLSTQDHDRRHRRRRRKPAHLETHATWTSPTHFRPHRRRNVDRSSLGSHQSRSGFPPHLAAGRLDLRARWKLSCRVEIQRHARQTSSGDQRPRDRACHGHPQMSAMQQSTCTAGPTSSAKTLPAISRTTAFATNGKPDLTFGTQAFSRPAAGST